MKIKILEPSGWYKHFVGSEFEIDYYEEISPTNLRFRVEDTGWVYNDHCVITELPKSFSVKRCDDKDKWEKYIDWLRKKYERNLDGYINKYYVVRDGDTFGKDVILGTEIHIDDMIKHIDYMERHIKGGEEFHKESQLTVKMNKIIKEEINMETQKLSRQGLKEIHSVACLKWKNILKTYGLRNPLEDYIELSQEEVNNMFDACTKEQLPIVSKYLKQYEDDLLDFDKISGSIQTPDGQQFIGKRVFGKFENKSFYLHNAYDWEIKEDDLGELCLIPTKKK